MIDGRPLNHVLANTSCSRRAARSAIADPKDNVRSARGRAANRYAISPSQASRCKMSRDFAMKMKLTAVFEKVPEGYIAFVEELPGSNTQGETIEEARTNLQ
jgi:hypothetical protein